MSPEEALAAALHDGDCVRSGLAWHSAGDPNGVCSVIAPDVLAALTVAGYSIVPTADVERLRVTLREMTLAYHTFNGRCTTDLPSCTSSLCVNARAALGDDR